MQKKNKNCTDKEKKFDVELNVCSKQKNNRDVNVGYVAIGK